MPGSIPPRVIDISYTYTHTALFVELPDLRWCYQELCATHPLERAPRRHRLPRQPEHHRFHLHGRGRRRTCFVQGADAGDASDTGPGSHQSSESSSSSARLHNASCGEGGRPFASCKSCASPVGNLGHRGQAPAGRGRDRRRRQSAPARCANECTLKYFWLLCIHSLGRCGQRPRNRRYADAHDARFQRFPRREFYEVTQGHMTVSEPVSEKLFETCCPRKGCQPAGC